MHIDIIIEDDRWTACGLDQLAERAAAATLSHLGYDPAAFEISILACDDARIATLNADFRGKPQPTNVLSWPETDLSADTDGAAPRPPPEAGASGPDEETGTGFLGDIAIAYDTCAREAAAQGLSFGDHATHLLVHATLHLLGYDHIRDRDATLMEGLETAILGKLGLRDPYREL